MHDGNLIPEISPEELISEVESGDDVQVLDVRAPERLVNGKIEAVPEERFHNIPGSVLMAMGGDPSDQGVVKDLPVAVVCNTGNSSKPVAVMLNQLGFQAQSVRGGMVAWMTALAPRELPAPPGFDRLIQFDRFGKGCLGYVLISNGKALVVDPPRQLDAYRKLLQEAEVEVVSVAETHVHADYISGGRQLADENDAPYLLHPEDHIYPYDGTQGVIEYDRIADGDEIEVGSGSVKVFHNPGHTDGSVTFIAGEGAALTGDFIFVKSIGRPDLAGKVDEWSLKLWNSLERARSEWPDTLRIYPAHYSSSQEVGQDHAVAGIWGELKEKNDTLKFQDSDRFSRWIKDSITTPPSGYPKIKAINLRLLQVSEPEADELEMGKNQCAVG